MAGTGAQATGWSTAWGWGPVPVGVVGLAVAALTVLALAGPASAARGQVTHLRFQGSFAEGFWATGNTGTFINAGASKKEGSGVVVDQVTTDPQTGNATETIAKGSASVTIDRSSLTSASVSASGLQGTTCTFDETGNQIGNCTSTTVDVTATWTGEGPISRAVSNEHFKTGGMSVTTHFNGTFRNATATVQVTGLPQPLGELQFADLGNTKQGDTTVCVGSC